MRTSHLVIETGRFFDMLARIRRLITFASSHVIYGYHGAAHSGGR